MRGEGGRRPVLLLAGEKGSGKSTVARFLMEGHGFHVCALGEYVRRRAARGGPAAPAEEERACMRALRSNGEGTVLAHLAQDVDRALARGLQVCVDSVFDSCDVDFFARRRIGWRLVIVSASEANRRARIERRGRAGDRDVGIWLPLESARRDFSGIADEVIQNDGDLAELRAKVARLGVGSR
jgi:dephospho-CoA kinase